MSSAITIIVVVVRQNMCSSTRQVCRRNRPTIIGKKTVSKIANVWQCLAWWKPTTDTITDMSKCENFCYHGNRENLNDTIKLADPKTHLRYKNLKLISYTNQVIVSTAVRPWFSLIVSLAPYPIWNRQWAVISDWWYVFVPEEISMHYRTTSQNWWVMAKWASILGGKSDFPWL